MAAVAAAGAAVARSRRRVIDSFAEQGAFAPESAAPFHPLRGLDERTMGRLVRQGILVSAEGERFYINRDALMSSNAVRRKFKVAVLSGVGLLAAIAAAATFLA